MPPALSAVSRSRRGRCCGSRWRYPDTAGAKAPTAAATRRSGRPRGSRTPARTETTSRRRSRRPGARRTRRGTARGPRARSGRSCSPPGSPAGRRGEILFTCSSIRPSPRAPSPPTIVASASTCCRSRRVAPAASVRARSTAVLAVAPSPWKSAKSARPAWPRANPGSASTAAANA